jgi:hypothetical protein
MPVFINGVAQDGATVVINGVLQVVECEAAVDHLGSSFNISEVGVDLGVQEGTITSSFMAVVT